MDNGHKHTCNLIVKDEGKEANVICEEKLKYLIEKNFNSHRSAGIDENISDRRATFRRVGDNEIVCATRFCSNCGERNDCAPRENANFGHLDNKRVSECRVNRSNLIECERCKSSNLNWYVNNLVMMKNKSSCGGGGDDAHTVAMETDVNGSSCDAPNGNNRLMTNENVVDHLKGMSLSDRRASVTPRITLTNVEDDPKQPNAYHQMQQQQDEAMITDEDQCSSPLSPRFLSVPKIEELGPERRPPQMVKTM